MGVPAGTTTIAATLTETSLSGASQHRMVTGGTVIQRRPNVPCTMAAMGTSLSTKEAAFRAQELYPHVTKARAARLNAVPVSRWRKDGPMRQADAEKVAIAGAAISLPNPRLSGRVMVALWWPPRQLWYQMADAAWKTLQKWIRASARISPSLQPQPRPQLPPARQAIMSWMVQIVVKDLKLCLRSMQ